MKNAVQPPDALDRLRDLPSLEPASSLDAKVFALAERAPLAQLSRAEAALNTFVGVTFALYVAAYVVQSVLW